VLQVRGFARCIHPEALSALAELFLVNGDMSAWLYTGSQAMHSERILIFEPEGSKLRKAGVGAYGNIMVGGGVGIFTFVGSVVNVTMEALW
jgi:hypothetical protein